MAPTDGRLFTAADQCNRGDHQNYAATPTGSAASVHFTIDVRIRVWPGGVSDESL